MAEMPVASSSPLSSPFSPSTHQEDYLGTQVKREQDSQVEESTTKRRLSSSSYLTSEEIHPSLTQDFSSLSPLSSLDQSPSPAREATKGLKRKVQSITPATKKRKVNPEGFVTGISSSLHHNAVIKQENDESEPKPLGRLARDIGHEVRKRSTRTTKTEREKPATIKAKKIKVEVVKTEITTSHQAQPSLSETEDDAIESDDFEDAVEYLQDPPTPSIIRGSRRPYHYRSIQTARKSMSGVAPHRIWQAQPPLSEIEDDTIELEDCEENVEYMQDPPAPSTIRGSRRPYSHRSIQTARKSTNGVTPRRISRKPEQKYNQDPPRPSIIRGPMRPFPPRGSIQAVRYPPTEGVKLSRSHKRPEQGKRTTSQPLTPTPNARMTRSRTGDNDKFMALDSDNTPTSVDNILLDLESIDRQHRLMMKMKKQAKARREGRVK